MNPKLFSLLFWDEPETILFTIIWDFGMNPTLLISFTMLGRAATSWFWDEPQPDFRMDPILYSSRFWVGPENWRTGTIIAGTSPDFDCFERFAGNSVCGGKFPISSPDFDCFERLAGNSVCRGKFLISIASISMFYGLPGQLFYGSFPLDYTIIQRKRVFFRLSEVKLFMLKWGQMLLA